MFTKPVDFCAIRDHGSCKELQTPREKSPAWHNFAANCHQPPLNGSATMIAQGWLSYRVGIFMETSA
jgi:hypothetical protein